MFKCQIKYEGAAAATTTNILTLALTRTWRLLNSFSGETKAEAMICFLGVCGTFQVNNFSCQVAQTNVAHTLTQQMMEMPEVVHGKITYTHR